MTDQTQTDPGHAAADDDPAPAEQPAGDVAGDEQEAAVDAFTAGDEDDAPAAKGSTEPEQ